MKSKLVFIAFLQLAIVSVNAQTDYLTVDKNIRLPKDSIERESLIDNLNKFLISIKNNNEVENWVLPEEKTETQLLIEEIPGFAEIGRAHV